MENRFTITEGCDRLTLQCDGGTFCALVWSSEHQQSWESRAVITRTDFQRGGGGERWIQELHSFDPETARPIIRVGEIHPVGNFRRCVYSWREWDLLANREVRFLGTSEAPVEDVD